MYQSIGIDPGARDEGTGVAETGNKTWDLRNFTLLKEMTIEFELGITPYIDVNQVAMVHLAKTWCFEVGGGLMLKLDSNSPACTHLISVPQSCATALRWI